LKIDWDLPDKTRMLRLRQSLNKPPTTQQITLESVEKDMKEKEKGELLLLALVVL